MLTLLGGGAKLCDGLSRREAMRIGGMGALGFGLGLSDLSRTTARADPGDSSFGRAKSCIVLFLMGGPPQHSTWDPKPDSPAEVRGAFGPIATTAPGVSISELLPKTARHGDKLCLVRAMSTGDNAHSSSGYYMLTGRPHQPMNVENANPGAPNDSPSLGALLGRVAPGRDGLPPAVTLPHRIFNTDGSIWPGQDAGLLGRGADPWLLNAKVGPEGYRVQEIALPADLDEGRLAGRRSLLDRVRAELDSDASAAVFERRSREAFDLLLSPKARRAFRLDDEPAANRERYGPGPFGQSVLMARRMVEAGVRLIQVNWYRGPNEPTENPCWDSHRDETNRLKTTLVPPFDQAFSALLEDLEARGLLDETLVACISEFGRSPRLDGNNGRNHWGGVFSIALAGGGIRGGQAFGASDKIGGSPKEGRVRPEDLSATLFHLLGHAPNEEYRDPLGRPLPISRGEVVRPILL